MNIKDQEGKTPLFYALRCKNIETVQALIEAGADIHMRDNNRNTPIAFAAKCGNERAVNLLFKSGANPYTVSSGCDACIKKNKKAWDLGIKLLNSINDRGISLIAEDLLQNHSHPFGINLNVQNQDGATALIKAVRFHHTKLAQQLIQCGADMNITDKGGNTALHEAAALGHEELVQTLINAKANINVRNSKGETPLHRAINQKNTPVVRALLTAGADKEIKNFEGKTASALLAKKVEALFNTNKEPVVIKKANSNFANKQDTKQNEG